LEQLLLMIGKIGKRSIVNILFISKHIIYVSCLDQQLQVDFALCGLFNYNFTYMLLSCPFMKPILLFMEVVSFLPYVLCAYAHAYTNIMSTLQAC
jgi:hypothetical protein